MKLLLKDIYTSKEIFERLATEKLSFKTVINLSRLVDRINKELQVVECERIKLIQEYGNLNEDGNYSILYDSENAEFFNQKINELLNVEIEISDVNKFNPIEFENINITLTEYFQLKPFIE